jgi:ubiquinone/menaquinone biosynthesis C-methylase UbiE
MIINILGSAHAKLVASRRLRVLGNMMRELLPPNARVLDVGCGDGAIAKSWMANRPDISVEGIDVLVRPATKIPVYPFDGQCIPFEDNSFDVVAFVDVLHHAENAPQLLREARRVSKTCVLIKDHYAENWFNRATLAFMDWVGNAPHGVARPHNFLSRKEWKEAFKTAALFEAMVETNIPLYPFPFDLVFGRKLHFIALLRKFP